MGGLIFIVIVRDCEIYLVDGWFIIVSISVIIPSGKNVGSVISLIALKGNIILSHEDSFHENISQLIRNVIEVVILLALFNIARRKKSRVIMSL